MKFLFLFLFSSPLYAWTLAGQTITGYNTDKVTVNFASTSCDGAGLTLETLRSNTEEAIDNYWNSVATANMTLEMGASTSTDIDGDTSASTVAQTKSSANNILVGCNNDVASFTSGTQGVGAISCSSSGECQGALIINAHSSSLVPSMSAAEVQALIAHELGHALGLGHSSVQTALMYYSFSGKTQEELHQDDINGYTWLYPNEKEAGGLMGSCGTIDLDDKGGPSNLLLTTLFAFLIIASVGRVFLPKG